MRNHQTAAALVILSLATSVQAEVHRVQWSASTELRETVTSEGVVSRLEHGIPITGHEWPARVVRVEIPVDATIADLIVRPRREQPITYAPASESERRGLLDVDPGAPSGESGGYPYWILPAGNYRGHRIGQILLTPFRRDGDRILFLEDFEVDVRTVAGETAALSRRIYHPRSAAADERALRLALDAEPRVATPANNAVPAADGEDTSQDRPFPPEYPTETLEYVIITNQVMAADYQVLADMKTREGMPAQVTTVEWILATYEGNDLSDRIRGYLRDLYLYQGLRYVLIGGDTDQVPTGSMVSLFQAPQGAPLGTDKFYACLDGDWNADGDEIRGEAPNVPQSIAGDDVDLYPEIAVGRVPTTTGLEVKRYIDKSRSYGGYDVEHFNTTYQAKILSLGEVLFPDDWEPGDDPGLIVLDGAAICESTLAYLPPTFLRTRLYQNYVPYPGALPEDQPTALARINQGYGIIDHVGHGYRTNMAVGDGKITNQDADGLTNVGKYSLLYAVNCASGAMSYDCIVEHLLLNPAGGIIAGVASSDLDYPSISDVFKYEFFDLLFNGGVTALADVLHGADLPWVPVAMVSENAYRWTILTLVAMGDPTQEIWRDEPTYLDLTFDPTLVLGTGSFSVTVEDGTSPVEGARVTLWKSDGYGVATTNAAGVAEIPFLPQSTGTFHVTAVKNSYVPAIDSSLVVAPVTAALRVSGVTMHDGTAGGGTGNGDGSPDAGESVVVELELRNDGSATATGVQAVLSAPSPFVTVTDGSAVVPNIAPGGNATVAAAFAYSVASTLPDTLRHVVVPATVNLVTNQGTWLEEMPFSIHQRILDLTALAWSIPDDDGDGFLENGETAELMLTLVNRGEAEAIDVVAVGTYNGSQFIFLDDTIQFGDMAPATTVQAGPFRLLSTGGGAPGLLVDLTVSDTYGTTLLARRLNVLRPTAPPSLSFDPAPTAIRLSWPRPGDADLRGYRVYRGNGPTGPFAEVTTDIIQGGSFYSDEGLPPLTAYWYRVAAIDSSGNTSAYSDTIRAGTSPPILEGWPVALPSGESKGSPTFSDLDWDGQMEVILGWSYPMVFRANGGDFVDGDNNAVTAGIFDDLGFGDWKFWNSPAVADIDGDHVLEIIFSAWQPNLVGELFVLDATGAVEPGWPRSIGLSPWSSAAVGDVDGDGDLEIFCESGSGGAGSYQGVLFGFHHDGTEIIDGDANPATHGVFYKSTGPDPRYFYGSPALADFDGDGDDEIVFLEKYKHNSPSESRLYVFNGNGSIRPGFPYGAGALSASTSSPAVADLNQDGHLEIIIVAPNRIAVVTDTGAPFAGWPKTLPTIPGTSTDILDFLSSPAVGDVNLDGNLDIALGWLDGKVYVWTGTGGAPHASFPVQVLSSGSDWDKYLHSPVIGNIDGDPNPEILVSSSNNLLHAVNHNGSVVIGFPLTVQGSVIGSPALWDLDNNGTVNLVVQSTAPVLEVFDFTTVPFLPAEHPWPMFRHDHRKSGTYSTPVLMVGVGDEPEAAPTAASVYPARPNPFVPRVGVPFDVPAGGERVRIRVFDLGGREVRRLADGGFPAGPFRVSWDGRTAVGRRLAPGVYFIRVEIGTKSFVQKVTMLR